jgi:hypothetical protein
VLVELRPVVVVVVATRLVVVAVLRLANCGDGVGDGLGNNGVARFMIIYQCLIAHFSHHA